MASIKDPLILPSDVILKPVADLSTQVRSQLEYDESDLALTRRNSRTPSKIVNIQAAKLLEEFRSAKTILEAILSYCVTQKKNPKEVLEEAFPLLQNLVNSQLLMPADSPNADRIEATLKPDLRLGNFQISYCLQVLQDTELYQARHRDGRVAAIKIVRPNTGPLGTYMLEREEQILSILDGRVNPCLLEAGSFEERKFLAIQWVEGISVENAALESRQLNDQKSLKCLLELCSQLIWAYTYLHDQHVIHADVHPSNVLVDAHGKVKLIDFGLAQVSDPALIESKFQKIQRGGVAFFFEPEYAKARLDGHSPPPADVKSEQYALAALLYYLLTGAHYLDFSLEQDQMLQQIAYGIPKLFANSKSRAQMSNIAQVLECALEKDPQRRHPGFKEFAEQFLKAKDTSLKALDSHAETTTSKQTAASSIEVLFADILKKLQLPGKLFRNGPPKKPTASVNYGAAGIAYALYRASILQDNPSTLFLADAWASRSAAEVNQEDCFYNVEIEITPETVGTISPYHTASGVFTVQAHIAQAMGDIASMEEYIRAFVAAAADPCENIDLTLGQSSILLTGALLFEMLPDKHVAETTGLLKLGQSILHGVWQKMDQYDPIKEAQELPILGIAHGWAGILYGTFRWCEATQDAAPSNLEERLQQLSACTEYVGRGARWPWQLNNKASGYMPGWCNGSAGYVFLWTQAHRMLADDTYLQIAEKAAWNAWEDPAQMANLCCGLAGRSYSLLHLYKYTNDKLWLEKARILADRAAINIRAAQLDEYQGLEHSLYKGELGVALLSADLAHPEESAQPFFESEGWTKKNRHFPEF